MEKYKRNFLYILVTGLVFIVIASFLYTQLFLNKKQLETQTPSPSPNLFDRQPSPLPPVPAQGETYQESLPKIREEEKEFLRESSQVGVLIQKLPFLGKNFSLTYDITTNQFLVTIGAGQEEEGHRELDQFLKENGIEDRSWLKNLKIAVE